MRQQRGSLSTELTSKLGVNDIQPKTALPNLDEERRGEFACVRVYPERVASNPTEDHSNSPYMGRRGIVVESSSRRVSFGAIGVEMGKWPPVGVSSPLTSRVWSRAFREHVCGACYASRGVR